MDLLRLAYYPFLPEVREQVRELGPDIPALLSSSRFLAARKRALARVQGALADGIDHVVVTDERGALLELLSVPVARMLCVAAGDRFLGDRYAAAEGRRVADVLRKDTPESLARVVDVLGLPIREDGGWSIHFADYLQCAPERNPKWKLLLRSVDRGRVPLEHDDVIALCGEALRRRIAADLADERSRPVPGDLKVALEPMLKVLEPELEQARERMQEGDFGPVRRELFPPCMTMLFTQMAQGVMIPHHGRFAVASFLATIGLDAQGIMDFFKEIPNFDPEKSRYQIEHIAGERAVESYTPPGCQWMQTNGVCPLEKRDNLCFKIKHPLSYYRAQIRFDKKNQEKAKALLAKNATEAEGAA